MAKHDLWPRVSADPPAPLLKEILNFYKLPDFPTVSLQRTLSGSGYFLSTKSPAVN